jgi:hypothetical protein
VGQLEFGPTRRARGGWAGTATIEYDGDRWAVDLDMIDAWVSDMVGFLEEVAQPSWHGSARWESEFAELKLEAESRPGGLVRLAFSVWWSHRDSLDNERRGELLVRADQIPEFAARVRQLTGLRGPAERFRPA